MDVADDFLVLLRELVHGVDDEDGYVAVVDGPDGADDAVPFQRFVDFALFPHARGVHEDEGLAFVGPYGVHGVPGGTHFVSYQGPFIAQEGIDESGFAYVRPAYDGGADNVFRFFFLRIRESFGNAVQKVPEAQAVHGGNADGVAETQGIELVNLHFLVFAVHFIHRHHYGLSGLPEEACDDFIVPGHAGPGVHDEEDHVRFFLCQRRLLPDAAGDLVFLIPEFDAPGVDQGKFFVQPFHVAVDSITGNPGDILYNGHAALGQPINKCGFADVWPTHNGYERFAHRFLSFQFCTIFYEIYLLSME